MPTDLRPEGLESLVPANGTDTPTTSVYACFSSFDERAGDGVMKQASTRPRLPGAMSESISRFFGTFFDLV